MNVRYVQFHSKPFGLIVVLVNFCQEESNVYNVLVVDDKEVFCRKISRMPYFKANTEKFSIKFMAQNGLEALELLEKEQIDIVLTDIRMPIIDGIELIKTIKSKQLCKCTILLSEYSEFAYAKQGLINGAFDYMVKPVSNENLQDTFERAYDFLNDLNKTSNPIFEDAEALADFLLDNNPKAYEVLGMLIVHMNNQESTIDEMVTLVKSVLERIHQLVINKREFISDYVPVKFICTLKYNPDNQEELFGILRKRIELLYDELALYYIKAQSFLIRSICNYILLNIEKDVSQQQIAKMFYVNKKYLSTLFKKEMGIHFVDYVTNLKMARARMLISYSDDKIYEIAVKLGYSDTAYFSKIFKKVVAVPPSSFNWEDYILQNY